MALLMPGFKGQLIHVLYQKDFSL